MNLHKTFQEHGYLVIDLPDKTPVKEASYQLQQKLNELLGKKVPLENYHQFAQEDEFHSNIQYALTTFFRENKIAFKVIASQLEFFKQFIGNDLLVQKSPYLRMTRPLKEQDNIGYHRDTFYGGSPYEISVLVPFIDVQAESSLKVMPGSHILPDKHFPIKQVTNPNSKIVKGSAMHQMGFLYAPKLMDPSTEEKMKPIPLKLGQALLFSLSLVHGAVVNSGKYTRWSSDIRVLNSLAPVDLSARADYYEPLQESSVTWSAKQYLLNNKEEQK